MKNILTVTFLLLVGQHILFAQSKSALNSEYLNVAIVERLDSEALGEERVLNMYLPYGYHPDSSATYPVIYLLDGSAHEDYLHIVGLVQFMNMYQLLPPSIVVGISNVDRYRDFTHLSTDPEDLKALPTSGGSTAFMDFLEEEAQPFVSTYYKTNGHRTIIGQSMGGLLAAEVLLTRPHLFNDYLIISPSLWWDLQSLVDRAPELLEAMPEQEKRIFVALGTEHPVMHQVAEKLVKAIRDANQEKMEVYHEVLPREDHATILHRGVYRGFEVLNPKRGE